MIRIVQLYPRDMNLYGDWGNARVLQKRLQWRGIDAEIVDHNPGDPTGLDGDIFLGGGGQDAGQDKIQEDLQHHIDELARLVEDGAPMLLICGMYQLLGRTFVTGEGKIIKGVGILPLDTRADGMALRLAYDDVPVGGVEADLQRALDRFAALNPGKPKRIYTTYTAMTALRKLMSGLALGQEAA